MFLYLLQKRAKTWMILAFKNTCFGLGQILTSFCITKCSLLCALLLMTYFYVMTQNMYIHNKVKTKTCFSSTWIAWLIHGFVSFFFFFCMACAMAFYAITCAITQPSIYRVDVCFWPCHQLPGGSVLDIGLDYIPLPCPGFPIWIFQVLKYGISFIIAIW